MKRSVLWWGAVALVVVATGALLGRPGSDGRPLDPSSTGPGGTRALVELLVHFEASVDRGMPAAGTDTVLVLEDHLDDSGRQDLLEWVGGGGFAVVADPGSPLVPPTVGDVADRRDVGTCDVEPLASLQAVVGAYVWLLPVDPQEASCFGDGQEAWLVVRRHGKGALALLGGPDPLVNANLGRADNAAVASALLLRGPGTRTRILFDPLPAPGDRTLVDLIPERVWLAVAQLVVAFALYVAWRGRRFGRPVPDTSPVELPGSLLVQARGDLYRRNRARARVADELRCDVERQLRRRLGVPAGEPLPVDEVARRLGVPAPDVDRLLNRPVPADSDGAVLGFAVALDELLRRLDPDASPTPSVSPVPPDATTGAPR